MQGHSWIIPWRREIVYGSAANTLAQLAKGTARQMLAMNSGATVPEWVASPQSVMTEQGDILYASAANTLSKLVHGTAGQLLRTGGDGANPAWSTNVFPNTATAGDLLYASATNTIAGLGIGTANYKLFTNSGATAQNGSWIYDWHIHRDMEAATADVAYTGVGFKPSHLIFVVHAPDVGLSVGFDNGTAHYCVYNVSTTYAIARLTLSAQGTRMAGRRLLW